jgi:hypothetical protein
MFFVFFQHHKCRLKEVGDYFRHSVRSAQKYTKIIQLYAKEVMRVKYRCSMKVKTKVQVKVVPVLNQAQSYEGASLAN